MTRFPTLLVLSPAGAGGKQVADGLRSLPGVCLPEQEIGFFSVHWDRGPKWYASWFNNCGEHDFALGEHSSSYVRASQAAVVAARIDGFLEDVRLVAVVRHPWARAREVFRARQSSGRVDESATFERLLHHVDDPLGLRAGGMYSQWLRPFRDRFGDRLLTMSSSRGARNADSTESLLRHLGLPIDLTARLMAAIEWRPSNEGPTTGVFDGELDVLASEFGIDLIDGA